MAERDCENTVFRQERLLRLGFSVLMTMDEGRVVATCDMDNPRVGYGDTMALALTELENRLVDSGLIVRAAL